MHKKQYLVVANWKMNLTLDKSVFLIKQYKKLKTGNAMVVIAPSYPAITPAAKELKWSKVKIAAQNCAEKDFGALTGEVSPVMLREIGCDYVILGHSERKKFFGEGFLLINKKIKAALANGLAPVVCIGEDWEERQEGRVSVALTEQLAEALAGVDNLGDKKIYISYEPFWTISTSQGSRVASSEEVEEACEIIRRFIIDLYGQETFVKNFGIIYGGTVNQETIKNFSGLALVEGFLVGSAGLDVIGFQKLIDQL